MAIHLPATVMGVAMVTLFLYGVLQGGVNALEKETNDIESLLEHFEEKHGHEDEHMETFVSLWGIPDTAATVGKVFKYPLPKDIFKGYKGHLQVKEVGKDTLPSWLEFHADSRTLYGVPSSRDLGQHVHIQVAPFVNTSVDASDIFTINIKEDKVHTGSSAVPMKDLKSNTDTLQPIKCPAGSSVTMATVIVDADLDKLSAMKMVRMIEGMCKHLKMPVDLLRAMPVGERPVFDSAALVAGPGDVKEVSHPGAMLQWEVGCGNVYARHMPILQQLELTANDGSMGKAVGHGIVGWHVTNNKPRVQRIKRQVHIQHTATPVPSIAPPTARPVATKTMPTDVTEAPITHVVPEMSSPTFQPSHPSHKPHRTKTSGRHVHTKSHQKPDATLAPTATRATIAPTRVVEAPSSLEPSVDRPPPPHQETSLGISRTMDMLQPSMTPSAPTRTHGPTEGLPTRTYTMPQGTTSGQIVPTETSPITQSTDKLLEPTPETEHKPTKKPGKKTTTRRPPPPPISTPPPTPFIGEEYNYAPKLNNHISRIDITVGDILEFKVPEDTFLDQEDGNTRNLKLVFLAVDGLDLPPTSWVKFNVETQTLYGLPMPLHAGRQGYLFAAIDSGGKIGRDAFEIHVKRRPREPKINHELSLTLDIIYDRFLVDVDQQIDVASKIAKMYGDEDLSKLTVTRIDSGSVVFAWTNNTIPYDPCPVGQIAHLLSYLITPNNTLNDTLISAMLPYRILKAGADPRGTCADNPENPNPIPIVTIQPSEHARPVDGAMPIPEEETDIKKQETKTSEEDILITTVVPAVVIAAMLLLAGIIAFILYRKKRKGKLSDEDQHTFINKGIPIIFQDELEDKPDPPTKPLIMDQEKPPLPPPEYPRSNPSTPRSDHKEPLIDTEDEGMPYEPPAPPAGSLHRQQRPRAAQPTYRNPPPYVPP